MGEIGIKDFKHHRDKVYITATAMKLTADNISETTDEFLIRTAASMCVELPAFLYIALQYRIQDGHLDVDNKGIDAYEKLHDTNQLLQNLMWQNKLDWKECKKLLKDVGTAAHEAIAILDSL